jgi:undecaprenyl-diphosphatase
MAGVPVPVLVGAGVAAACAAAVAGLVDGADEHADLSSHDPGITASVASLRRPLLTIVAELASLVGSEACIALLSLLVLGWMWSGLHDRVRAVIFAGAMGVGVVLTLAGKRLVARQRPPAAYVVGPVDHGYSFPSGHTVFSTVFLGLVVLLLVWPGASRAVRAAAVVLAVAGSLLVGASRVYLGYHWTTDVGAGWVLGVSVLSLTVACATPLTALATMMLTRTGLHPTAPGEERAPRTTMT